MRKTLTLLSLLLIATFSACDVNFPTKDDQNKMKVEYEGDQLIDEGGIKFRKEGGSDKGEGNLGGIENGVVKFVEEGKPFSRISGWVLDQNGEPKAAHLEVSPIGEAFFTKDGHFVFDVAIRPNTAYTVKAKTPDGKFKGEVQVLAVQEGETRADVILEPVEEVGFLVRVMDKEGTPIEKALVTVRGTIISEITNGDGEARLVGGELIAEHTYTIRVEKEGYVPVEKTGKAQKGLQVVNIILKKA